MERRGSGSRSSEHVRFPPPVLYLLDTNVFREVQKGPQGHPNVRAWLGTVDDADLRLSVMTIVEARRGIAKLAKSDADRAGKLERSLDAVVAAYRQRVVEIDRDVAAEWGRLIGEKDKHRDDMAFAASARVHGGVLVTRNVKDFVGRGVRVLDPFKRKPEVATV